MQPFEQQLFKKKAIQSSKHKTHKKTVDKNKLRELDKSKEYNIYYSDIKDMTKDVQV